jgi:hypothetical protein
MKRRGNVTGFDFKLSLISDSRNTVCNADWKVEKSKISERFNVQCKTCSSVLVNGCAPRCRLYKKEKGNLLFWWVLSGFGIALIIVLIGLLFV